MSVKSTFNASGETFSEFPCLGRLDHDNNHAFGTTIVLFTCNDNGMVVFDTTGCYSVGDIEEFDFKGQGFGRFGGEVVLSNG